MSPRVWSVEAVQTRADSDKCSLIVEKGLRLGVGKVALIISVHPTRRKRKHLFVKPKFGALIVAMNLVLASCSSSNSVSENSDKSSNASIGSEVREDTLTIPEVKDVEQFAFQYNLHGSLPEAWISEFQSIMKNLGETLPINPNIREYVQNNVMNIYAWKSDIINPFPEKHFLGIGPSISGNAPNNRWMLLEINEDQFENNSLRRYSVVVHEYFHVYQIALSKDSMSPKWLVEGGAKVLEDIYAQQYYGNNSLQDDLNNPDLWSDDVFTNPSLYEEFETSYVEIRPGKWMDMNYSGSSYLLLALVKELQKQGISEQRAFEMVFRDFWIEISTQQNWKFAFEQLFKINVNTFYEMIKNQTRNDANNLLPSESLTIQEIFVST